MSARRLSSIAAAIVSAALAACGGGTPGPASLDPRHDACRSCRMTVSDLRFAAQLAAPGEEVLFFDDIGCLAAHLREQPRLPPGAVAYVADHRTRQWIVAAKAIYTRVDRLDTPMNSHLIAHADEASAGADAGAQGGVRVAAQEIFGPAGPPGGRAAR